MAPPRTIGILLAAWAGLATPAAAAEITLLSTMNIRPAIDDLRRPFETASGHRVTIQSQGSASTRRRAESETVADAVINSRPILDALAAQGRIVPGSIVDIAHSSIGLVVRAGAPQPAVATDAALKDVLLRATSISYPNPAGGSLGGIYFAGLLSRLGIADEVARKTRLTGGGAACGRLVAAGEAELAINQIAELLPVSGIAFLSPLPPALQDKVVMAAGIATGARQAEAAADWIRFLASPAASGALKAHGMAP